MRPFQQLRLWLRSGPTAERTLTGIAGLVVLALVVWAALPTLSPDSPTDALTGAPLTGNQTASTGAAQNAASGTAAGSPAGAAAAGAVAPETSVAGRPAAGGTALGVTR